MVVTSPFSTRAQNMASRKQCRSAFGGGVNSPFLTTRSAMERFLFSETPPRSWRGPGSAVVVWSGTPGFNTSYATTGTFPPYWAAAFYQGFDAASHLCPAPDLSSLTGLYVADIALHVVLIAVMSVFTLLTAWMTVAAWFSLALNLVITGVHLAAWLLARRARVNAFLIALALCAVGAASWRWQEGLKTCFQAALSAGVGLRDLTLWTIVLVVNKVLLSLGVTARILAWYIAWAFWAALAGFILGFVSVCAVTVRFAWVLLAEGWALDTVRGWLPWRQSTTGLAADPWLPYVEDRFVNADGEVVQTATFLGGAPSPVEYAQALTRVRRRARWVRALETYLGGRRGVVGTFLRGRWTPDLPAGDGHSARNYLVGSVENGARVLGGGLEQVGEGRNPAHGVYFHLDTGDEVQVIFPYLLGKLRQYALFRERDELLLGALRSRAIEWCKGEGLRTFVSDMAVAAAVSLAMEPSTHEQVAHARVTRVTGATLTNASL